MKRVTLSSALAIVGVVFGLGSAAPVPGPGGVYHAVVDLCAALDAGDAGHLRKAFAADRHGLEFFEDEDGELATREPEGAFEFVDEGADGSALCATTLEALLERVGNLADDRGKPVTTIRRVYADCPSGDCSYAVVEFDRAWGSGDERRVVPMRATALVQYVGGEAPHFRVFHWHASRR